MATNLQGMAGMWQKAGLGQRVLLLTVVLSCVGVGALLVNWARRPHMTLLYSGLDPAEASKIVDKIRDAECPYELKSGGSAIYVPEEKVYSLRLTVASEGLPIGAEAGYKILDEDKLGASPFAQRINYRRAIEGELAKTIQMLDGVVWARVHVARPEPSLFAGRQKDASATVALGLKAGHRLSGSNVAAIVHLVAGSIEGLAAQDVVVVDSQGTLVSSQGSSELARGSSSFLDYKSRVEEYLAQKAEEQLTAVLGPNRASVQVDATIETSSSNQTKTTYLPDGRVVTREEEKSKSSVPPPGGGVENAGGANSTKESTMSTEYLVSKTVEERRDLPGNVKSISVAALVDLSADEASAEGGAAASPKITVEDVKDIIRKAIGVSEAEAIKVVSAAFHRPPAAPVEEGQQAGVFNRDFYLEIAKRSSLGILVIGALVALKIFGKSKGGSALPALESETGQGGGLLTAQGSEVNPEVLRTRITHALQENPEEVRRLFLTWVQGEEGER